MAESVSCFHLFPKATSALLLGNPVRSLPSIERMEQDKHHHNLTSPGCQGGPGHGLQVRHFLSFAKPSLPYAQQGPHSTQTCCLTEVKLQTHKGMAIRWCPRLN